MPNYETKAIFAHNLTRLLTENNITQIELAGKMKVAASTVSSWCNGEKMPRMDKVEWMANYFSVPTSSLIEASQQNSSYNIVKIFYRNGTYREKFLSDEDLVALTVLFDRLPDASSNQ